MRHVGIPVDRDIRYYKPRILKATGIDKVNLIKEKQVLAKYYSLIMTRNSLMRIMDTLSFVLETQSSDQIAEMSTGTIDANTMTKEQNLTDVVGAEADEKQAGSQQLIDKVPSVLSMDNYLSRPVTLLSTALTLASENNIQLSVWNLFTAEPSVRAKLRNFGFLRGTLCVRVAVSGSPFHYGRLLLSYQPLASSNEVLEAYNTMGSTRRQQLLTYLSQSEGSTTLDVRSNKPVDMKCPFIWPKPYGRLFNSSSLVISSGTAYEDFANMGDLYIYSINNIAAVSAAPTQVFLYVYAWMEDVELRTPTATQIEITTESSDYVDENVVGPVEQFASSAKEVSDKVGHIPWIEPYARASSMMFSALGGIASLFGWSKPIINKESNYVKNVGFRNGANTIGYDTTYKLTMDPKQGLSVDPRVGGVEEDQLAIATIASRESYLTSFTWGPSDLPTGSGLYTCGVTPYLSSFSAATAGNTTVQPTSVCFAAQPFTYWRGDITFRFEIVCSQYHRGKILIGFEPNSRQSPLFAVGYETNKQFMKVVDIQETQNVSFCVRWTSQSDWLTRLTAGQMQDVSNPSLEVHKYNGFIFVRPFTSLQSPDGSSISVNVYVMSDNIEFAGPTSEFMPTNRSLTTQSGDFFTESSQYVSGEEISCIDMNVPYTSHDTAASRYFGERVLSFRSLLKRYVREIAYNSAASVANSYDEIISIISPRFQINFNGSPIGTGDLTLYNYLRFAYVGWKGSIRRRIVSLADDDSMPTNGVMVSLMPPSSSNSGSFTNSTAISNLPPERLEGNITHIPYSNGGIEFEAPFYMPNQFGISFNTNVTGGLPSEGFEAFYFREFRAIFPRTASDVGAYYVHYATGEDFDFIRYQGAPFYSL